MKTRITTLILIATAFVFLMACVEEDIKPITPSAGLETPRAHSSQDKPVK